MSRQRRPEPPPLQTNDVLIAMVGTAAWAVALVVLLFVGLPEPDRWWLWVCVVAIGIGLFGVWYIPRLHRGRAAAIARHTPDVRHEGNEDTEGKEAEESNGAANHADGEGGREDSGDTSGGRAARRRGDSSGALRR